MTVSVKQKEEDREYIRHCYISRRCTAGGLVAGIVVGVVMDFVFDVVQEKYIDDIVENN